MRHLTEDHLTQEHLTEEQITGMLMGDAPDAAAAAHMAACVECRGQVSLFEDAVGDFNAASLAWADARPSASLRAQTAIRPGQRWFAPVGWAVVAAAALIVGVPVWQHEHRAVAVPATAAERPGEGATDSAAQIAADNGMMAQVDGALSADDESPLREYGLSYGPAGAETNGGEAKVQ